MSHIEPLASYTPRGYFAVVSVARAIARPSENAIAAVLGVVLVGGVYADGWAHLNIGGLETFFSRRGTPCCMAGLVCWSPG
jgi:hypothetical protein